jgi:hypothetical protein
MFRNFSLKTFERTIYSASDFFLKNMSGAQLVLPFHILYFIISQLALKTSMLRMFGCVMFFHILLCQDRY